MHSNAHNKILDKYIIHTDIPLNIVQKCYVVHLLQNTYVPDNNCTDNFTDFMQISSKY